MQKNKDIQAQDCETPYKPSFQRILIVTSTAAEQSAILSGLPAHKKQKYTVIIGGVGCTAAAVHTTRALSSAMDYQFVINMGIGGGFSGKTDLATLVVSSHIVAADLGAETAVGFCSLDTLGLGSAHISIDPQLATYSTAALQAANLPVCMGTILTMSTVTGTAATASLLAARINNATAEAMEGYGVAVAAQQFHLPVLEIRALCNLVGPRHRNDWRIKDAMELLTAASSILSEVL